MAESGRLASIVPIVAATRAPVVVVPGGGTFADAVRVAQAELGFDDAVAHHMAILAMHQTAHMLAGLEARLAPVETLPAIRRALAEGRIPVWLPWKLSEHDTTIPADWSVTSDGLAARLAERLGRASVVLHQIVQGSGRRHASAPCTGRNGRSDLRRDRRAGSALLARAGRRR